MSDNTDWETSKLAINQGKRLIKRMRKLNVIPGREYPMLLDIVKQAYLKDRLNLWREANLPADAAMKMAMDDVAAMKIPVTTGHAGRDLFELLVSIGVPPGRCKSALDELIDNQMAGLGGGL